MFINVLIGIAVVGLLIARQLKTRSVKEDSALRLMVILAGVGLVETVDACKHHSPSTTAIALIVASMVVAAVLGAVRGMSVQVWRDDAGAAWRRGTWMTAALWILALGSHLGLEVLIDGSTTIKGLGSATILMYLAATLGAQREVVRARVAQLRPLARQR